MWIIDLYVLLTSRVPLPRMLFLFGIVTMSSFTVLAPFSESFLNAGLIVPVLSMVLGHLAVLFVKLPETVARLNDLGWKHPEGRLLFLYIAGYALVLGVPSVAVAQSTLTVGIVIYVALFVLLNAVEQAKGSSVWFAQTWDTGRSNAANWHIARLVALILLNETVRQNGTPTDWVIALSIGPIALHYLMYWTIIATHPQGQASDTDPKD